MSANSVRAVAQQSGRCLRAGQPAFRGVEPPQHLRDRCGAHPPGGQRRVFILNRCHRVSLLVLTRRAACPHPTTTQPVGFSCGRGSLAASTTGRLTLRTVFHPSSPGHGTDIGAPGPERRSNRYRNPGPLRYPASVTARGHAVDNVEWGKLPGKVQSIPKACVTKPTKPLRPPSLPRSRSAAQRLVGNAGRRSQSRPLPPNSCRKNENTLSASRKIDAAISGAESISVDRRSRWKSTMVRPAKTTSPRIE